MTAVECYPCDSARRFGIMRRALCRMRGLTNLRTIDVEVGHPRLPRCTTMHPDTSPDAFDSFDYCSREHAFQAMAI